MGYCGVRGDGNSGGAGCALRVGARVARAERVRGTECAQAAGTGRWQLPPQINSHVPQTGEDKDRKRPGSAGIELGGAPTTAREKCNPPAAAGGHIWGDPRDLITSLATSAPASGGVGWAEGDTPARGCVCGGRQACLTPCIHAGREPTAGVPWGARAPGAA